MAPQDPSERELNQEQRLTRMETKIDMVLGAVGPDGEIHRRIGAVEEEQKNMRRGAVATIVTIFISIFIGFGAWVFKKLTGQDL